MFKKESSVPNILDSSSQIPTVVSESFVLNGSVEKAHNIRIEGTILGDIKQANSVVIGVKGTVKGNIRANHVTIHGYVEGNISALKSASIKYTGKVIGTLNTTLLNIEHGAVYEGYIIMETPQSTT